MSLAAQQVVEHPSVVETYWEVKKGLTYHATLAAEALPAAEQKLAHLAIPNDPYPVRSLCSQFAVLSLKKNLCDHYNMRQIRRCFATEPAW